MATVSTAKHSTDMRISVAAAGVDAAVCKVVNGCSSKPGIMRAQSVLEALCTAHAECLFLRVHTKHLKQHIPVHLAACWDRLARAHVQMTGLLQHKGRNLS